jgi:hypothetical protein
LNSIKIAPLFIGMAMFLVAHILTFFQLNGQFLWKSFQKNEWAVASTGIILSFFYIWGTKYTVEAFGGLLWPGRFVAFGLGMIIYAIMVGYYFNEGINLKTMTSLILSIGLVCVQVFWKL